MLWLRYFADVNRAHRKLPLDLCTRPTNQFWDKSNAWEEAAWLAENGFVSSSAIPLVLGAVAVSLGVAVWHDCVPFQPSFPFLG